MLQLRPNCECCNRDLPPESVEARICSFECTFCARCAETVLNGKCPNCGGELVVRLVVPEANWRNIRLQPSACSRLMVAPSCKRSKPTYEMFLMKGVST
jgi:hypothetical protein